MRKFACIAWVAFAVVPAPARADFDFARVRAAMPVLPSALTNAHDQSVGLVLERTDASAATPVGARPIAGDFFSFTLPAREVDTRALPPGFVAHWAPARHLLVDRALGWARVSEFRAAFNTPAEASGRGVVVGIVDTGIALDHPDFLDENGASRVRWLIDFTRPPASQPGGAALEVELGCSADHLCAVYSASDLTALLANAISGDEPRDNIGHGTHVASLAAGSGRSRVERTYAGVAPEADLVIARVTDGQVGISDPVILEAVRFVFDRASELGEPAVVNLSLGSDLGAHDGSSALERALAAFVGSDQPGHAIVVAAGNSAGLYRGLRAGFPDPLGIHTEVHVPRESQSTVTLLTPDQVATTSHGRISVWISSRPGDELSVGFERSGRAVGEFVSVGSAEQLSRGDLSVIVLNGIGAAGTQPLSKNQAVLVLDGQWPSGETFGVRLEGHGTASLWVEGAGDVGPAVSVGPLFPLAQKEGSINVPAAAPELIAVGASMNRGDWVDFDGISISRPQNGALQVSPADTIAYFSGAGPTALGEMKPDIVAPGLNVVGAMSSLVDPRVHAQSMFAGIGTCGSVRQCLVVDDFHAVASGTSMASPIVAGAVALLLQQDPTLTGPQIRALLQAGARRLEGAESFEPQVGLGALDLRGALDALRESDAATRLPTRASWLSLPATLAHPDPEWPLIGYAELRDDVGHLADGFDSRRLTLGVEGARVVEPLHRIAPAFYRFSVAAPRESGGESLALSLRFDGVELARRTQPIAVDRGALLGLAVPRAGCAFAARGDVTTWLPLGMAVLALARRRLRRAS